MSLNFNNNQTETEINLPEAMNAALEQGLSLIFSRRYDGSINA